MVRIILSWLPVRLVINTVAVGALLTSVCAVSREVDRPPSELFGIGLKAVGLHLDGLSQAHRLVSDEDSRWLWLTAVLVMAAVAASCAAVTGIRWGHPESPMFSAGTYVGTASVVAATDTAGIIGLAAIFVVFVLVVMTG